MFKKKVAEYAAAIKTFLQAITENNDKAADIIKHMEEETALKNGNHAVLLKYGFVPTSGGVGLISIFMHYYNSPD